MYEHHVPAKYLHQAPKVVRTPEGIDQWVFQGAATSTPFGMAATVGWPAEEWGRDPGTYSELRPGCFDLAARLDDMDANGVLASMCFPSMAGYNARTFAEAPDKALSLMMLQAYNDWHVDEWCAGSDGRLIPLGMVPMWGADLAADEVRRLAKKGCRAISFLEAPHAQGYPSLLSGYWDPMLQACVDESTVLCLHIGGGMSLIKLAPEAPADHSIIVPTQVMTLVAQDLLFSHIFKKFPTLKVAFSEAGIGWIPFYLERVDRHVQNQVWMHNDFGGKLPVRGLPRARPRLLHHRPDRAEDAARDRHRHHRLGVRLPAYRHHLAGVPRGGVARTAGRRRERRGDPQDHLAERVPVLRLRPVHQDRAGRRHGGRAARPGGGQAHRHHAHVQASSGASATRRPGSGSSRNEH